MRSVEKKRGYESLEGTISRIAYAYGFTTTPMAVSRKTLSATPDLDPSIATALAVIGNTGAKTPTQVWGSAKRGGGTTLSFAILATKHAIAHAIVVKAALAIAESTGYTDLSVSVSSVGDNESRKRFTRELTNFFKKHGDSVPPEVKHASLSDPDAAYRMLLEQKDASLERAPRTIDYLSESSRKTMLDTLALFESIEIAYTLEPRLSGTPAIHSELLFAVEGTDKKGERIRVATGGRYDEHLKKQKAGGVESAVAISVNIPDQVAPETLEETPSCFVVHVGDASKLKAFKLLEALWRAHIAVGQALMSENLKDQMGVAQVSGAKYVAIIGQREALDGTVIVRSAETQMQTTLPLTKLAGYVGRRRV